METVSTTPATTTEPARRWPFFLLGVVLFFLGPVVNALQIFAGQLTMPWYFLGLTTAGVVLMLTSVWQRRGVFRTLALLFFLSVCVLSWYFTLVVSKTPEYVGPATAGNRFPDFAAKLAHGKAFTQSDLANGERSALVFFRGRW